MLAVCFSEERINLTQTSKRQIKAVSRAIPLPPPAAQGRTGQGLLQQCGVSQAEPQQLPQPCAQRLVSGNAASGRALPTSQILTLGSQHPGQGITFPEGP